MDQRSILIYHIGSLGDTLVALPALRVVRENFPAAHIALLTDNQQGERRVQPQEILAGSGLVDEYLFYGADRSASGKALRLFRMASLLVLLRKRGFDTLVYLVRANAGDTRIKRDRDFFRLAGISSFLGMQGIVSAPLPGRDSPLPKISPMADQLLHRLEASGLSLSPAFPDNGTLNIGEVEHAAVQRWIERNPPDGNRRWIGIGIGGKMPVNNWPLDRYGEVGRRLIEQYDLWPVIFGGVEDRLNALKLVESWQRGYIAAGDLMIRESLSALARCILFVGNDTGTIHMAAAAGVSCIGIYSSRNYPGEWDPYGGGHTVLRKSLPCEGCRLERCTDRNSECILSISVDDVLRTIAKKYALSVQGEHASERSRHGQR